MLIMRKNDSRRLPAFTLTEVIIVMAVSSVIIAAAVSFIVMIGKSGEDNLNDYSFNADAITTMSILEYEFKNAETIRVEKPQSLTLYFSNGEELVLTFISGTGIVLSGQRNDTLVLDLSSWSVGMVSRREELVNRVSIEITNGRSLMLLVCIKNYSRASYFNQVIYEN
jgi:prepilin-type N-terminal cleavage/methylation domain-containing protein